MCKSIICVCELPYRAFSPFLHFLQHGSVPESIARMRHITGFSSATDYIQSRRSIDIERNYSSLPGGMNAHLSPISMPCSEDQESLHLDMWHAEDTSIFQNQSSASLLATKGLISWRSLHKQSLSSLKMHFAGLLAQVWQSLKLCKVWTLYWIAKIFMYLLAKYVPIVVADQAGVDIRPRIFMYDLPDTWKQCAPHIDMDDWSFSLYGSELQVARYLKSSPHLTEFAEEADFFYVPAMFHCATKVNGSGGLGGYLRFCCALYFSSVYILSLLCKAQGALPGSSLARQRNFMMQWGLLKPLRRWYSAGI